MLMYWRASSLTPSVWFSIIVGLILLALGVLPKDFQSSMYFTLENYNNGQWWLPISCQWVHLNFQHTVANIAGLILLFIFVLNRVSVFQVTLCTFSCLISISFLLVLYPDLYAFYAGFSGILYGLFFWGGMNCWHQDKIASVFILFAIIAKVSWDIVGPSAFATVEWLEARIAVEVHISGVAGAILFYVVHWFYQLIEKSSTKVSG